MKVSAALVEDSGASGRSGGRKSGGAGLRTSLLSLIGEESMANSWLRLWHDMPDDPKWRTIAEIANEPISTVQAIYLRLLVASSQNDPRGEAHINPVVTASALGIQPESVLRILEAMQGLVMNGDHLTGWERRQPAREDPSTDRVREFRKRNVTRRNARSVFVTQRNADSSSETLKPSEISPFAH